MIDWLGSRPGQTTVLLLMLLGPLALGLIFGGPRIPAWDACTIGWAIPC